MLLKKATRLDHARKAAINSVIRNCRTKLSTGDVSRCVSYNFFLILVDAHGARGEGVHKSASTLLHQVLVEQRVRDGAGRRLDELLLLWRAQSLEVARREH